MISVDEDGVDCLFASFHIKYNRSRAGAVSSILAFGGPHSEFYEFEIRDSLTQIVERINIFGGHAVLALVAS